MASGSQCAVGWLRPGPPLLAALLLLASCAGESPRPDGDVVLVILDTTRADHLSAYGYERSTSPNLERLAGEGELYLEAWAQAPWTLPAVATLLTGEPPHAHGAGLSPAGVRGLRPSVGTLAERLRGAGLATAAFFNVVWCDPELSSFDRGFDHYDVSTSDASNRGHRDARETTDAALAWLRELGEKRVFLVVHYFDPHLTYDPPAPFDRRFEPDAAPGVPAGLGSVADLLALRAGALELSARERASLVARYDGEIAFVDRELGRLRAGLEALGRWDDALVVVVGDHGEEFWDHGGFEHGHTHHRELLHVPLVVRRPGGPRGAVRAGRVRQIDVAPTVLEFAGLPADDLPGQVLGEDGARHAVAEGSLWGGDLVSVRTDEGTLILHRGLDRRVAFDSGDVLEVRPLLDPAQIPSGLSALLEALPRARDESGRERPPSEEQIERLRALGYVR